MTKIQAIKAFFGDKRPVTNDELFALKVKDESGETYMSSLGRKALIALGETEG